MTSAKNMPREVTIPNLVITEKSEMTREAKPIIEVMLVITKGDHSSAKVFLIAGLGLSPSLLIS